MSGGPVSSKHDPTNNSLSGQSARTGRDRRNRNKKKRQQEETMGLLWDLENIPTINHNKKDK